MLLRLSLPRCKCHGRTVGFTAEKRQLSQPIFSPRPFGGRGVGGEGGSSRWRFSQSIPTFACPHPNPLPEGEGDFLG